MGNKHSKRTALHRQSQKAHSSLHKDGSKSSSWEIWVAETCFRKANEPRGKPRARSAAWHRWCWASRAHRSVGGGLACCPGLWSSSCCEILKFSWKNSRAEILFPSICCHPVASAAKAPVAEKHPRWQPAAWPGPREPSQNPKQALAPRSIAPSPSGRPPRELPHPRPALQRPPVSPPPSWAQRGMPGTAANCSCFLICHLVNKNQPAKSPRGPGQKQPRPPTIWECCMTPS